MTDNDKEIGRKTWAMLGKMKELESQAFYLVPLLDIDEAAILRDSMANLTETIERIRLAANQRRA